MVLKYAVKTIEPQNIHPNVTWADLFQGSIVI